jgi:transcriptional regulator with XRE-family HTH domain
VKDNETKARFIELRGKGPPLKRIADEIGVSKTILVNWERDFKEQIDNLRAMELEALYDKYFLSVRKKVEFFGDVLSRIQGELKTRNLSTVPTEKLFAMYAHFYREAQHALPQLTFLNDDEVKIARGKRLPTFSDVILFDHR